MEQGKTITAALVKELRERTGAGMMQCKDYLKKSNADIDLAIDMMRKEGSLKAAKKGGRITAEGLVAIVVSDDNNSAAMVEVNSETDFVARGEDFQQFAHTVAQAALTNQCNNLPALLAANLQGHTVEDARMELIAKLGENINVRRVAYMQATGQLYAYVHGAKIGVLVDVTASDNHLGSDIAMHIAASSPIVIAADNVPDEIIAKEKEIYSAQAQESGKPADIIEKMVVGRISKFLDEVSLHGQAFVKNPDMKVKQLLEEKKATVNHFTRFEVGEGIEKREDDFVAEVMAQARGE